MSAQVVRSFSDRDISTLPAVLDSIELSGHLRRVLPSHWGALEDVQIKVVRNHHGKRCTVEIDLQTTTGRRHLIGKLYPKDRSDVYQTMSGLRQAGFGSNGEFSVPQPMAYLAALRLLLYEKVQGLRADKVFLSGNERERTIAADRCARWLVRFQAEAPHPKRVLGLTNYLASMEQWSRVIAEGGEPFSSKASRLFKKIKVAAWALNNIEMCASHGDFGTRNVIFVEKRTVVYDWDGCKLANPCRDIASFIVDLRRLGLQRLGAIRALDAAIKEFQDTYSGLGCQELLRDIPFYRAARCLEVANIIFRKQKSQWRENVVSMLDEGFRAFEHWL
jgi:aminoglycoside phosphotransferase (APT) family kinase protein